MSKEILEKSVFQEMFANFEKFFISQSRKSKNKMLGVLFRAVKLK